MISAVPTATPVTMPLAEPTLATLPLLLLHAPLVGVELSVLVDPSQIVRVPVMPVGVEITVTVLFAEQPLLSA